MKGRCFKRGATWSICYDAPSSHAGHRKQVSKGGFRTRKIAEEELRRRLREIETGTYIEPSKQTVGTYLAYWLDHFALGSVANKTYERYAGIVNQRLIPALGPVPLSRLNAMQIQAFYRSLSGQVSASTVNNYHRTLNAALNKAKELHLIPHNPAAGAEPPKSAHVETAVLSPEEVLKLLSAVEGKLLYLPILLAVSTGLRRGEILGLEWSDIDLDAGFLAVSRSIEHTRLAIGPAKVKETKSGRKRIVPLPQFTIDALRDHREQQDIERRMHLAETGGYVISTPEGGLVLPGRITLAFMRLTKRLGMSIRFHDLRHTYATLQMEGGGSLKAVSETLGHSGIGITADIYGHLTAPSMSDLATRMDGILRSQNTAK